MLRAVSRQVSTRLRLTVVASLVAAIGCGRDLAAPPWTAEAADRAASDRLIPARVRRLSNSEYDGSVAALLGTQLTPGRSFTPDARQSGFTANEAQRVDAVVARQLYAAAEDLAAEARAQLAPCPSDADSCGSAFIADFAARAYRRPLSAAESAGLLELFRAGADGASYEDGIELVIQAVLQTGSFLYLSELGEPSPEDAPELTLTPYEIASSLAYLMTGAPPDAELTELAAAGALAFPDVRRGQLERLRYEHPGSLDHLVRTLREWLELDRIEITAKDVAFYPLYETLEAPFVAESHEFIAAVLSASTLDPSQPSDLEALLSADWTVGDPLLADFYQAKDLGDRWLGLPARRGVLNQGAFLAVHSHAYESAPVLRGAVIARRLACIDLPDPSSLGISVVAPPADPAHTTRERFAAHDADPTCAGCHKAIDSFGNAFEQYDGMGALRTTENGVPVDSTTEIALGLDFDGAYVDSNALAQAMASSALVQECFARHLFRAVAARSGESRALDPRASEDAFIAEWRARPEHDRGNVLDTLSAFVESRLFTQRRAR
jgi:hypothetical protein